MTRKLVAYAVLGQHRSVLGPHLDAFRAWHAARWVVVESGGVHEEVAESADLVLCFDENLAAETRAMAARLGVPWATEIPEQIALCIAPTPRGLRAVVVVDE